MKPTEFDSVWEALEPSRADAANMRARANLMIAIQQTIANWQLTQDAAAKRLGLTQPRLNDLLRGRIDKFSLDSLLNHAALAGLEVKITIVRSAA